jgi:hypothetical protein
VNNTLRSDSKANNLLEVDGSNNTFKQPFWLFCGNILPNRVSAANMA